jgi:hypothetical protein
VTIYEITLASIHLDDFLRYLVKDENGKLTLPSGTTWSDVLDKTRISIAAGPRSALASASDSASIQESVSTQGGSASAIEVDEDEVEAEDIDARSVAVSVADSQRQDNTAPTTPSKKRQRSSKLWVPN